jgi:hypothetical protein
MGAGRLHVQLVYYSHSELLGCDSRLCLPGMCTDLASVPQSIPLYSTRCER